MGTRVGFGVDSFTVPADPITFDEVLTQALTAAYKTRDELETALQTYKEQQAILELAIEVAEIQLAASDVTIETLESLIDESE